MIITNTFGASRARLERLGLGDDAKRVVSDAVKIARDARDAAGRPTWIAGSIGPLDADWLLDTNPSAAQQRHQFQEQAELLLDRGVDLVVLETFSRLDELLLAIAAVITQVHEGAHLLGRQLTLSHGIDHAMNCQVGVATNWRSEVTVVVAVQGVVSHFLGAVDSLGHAPQNSNIHSVFFRQSGDFLDDALDLEAAVEAVASDA